MSQTPRAPAAATRRLGRAGRSGRARRAIAGNTRCGCSGGLVRLRCWRRCRCPPQLQRRRNHTHARTGQVHNADATTRRETAAGVHSALALLDGNAALCADADDAQRQEAQRLETDSEALLAAETEQHRECSHDDTLTQQLQPKLWHVEKLHRQRAQRSHARDSTAGARDGAWRRRPRLNSPQWPTPSGRSLPRRCAEARAASCTRAVRAHDPLPQPRPQGAPPPARGRPTLARCIRATRRSALSHPAACARSRAGLAA
jgi:hypothetical protein